MRSSKLQGERSMKKNSILSLTLFILFVFFSASVYAQEGPVNACYKKRNGTLRIVSDPSLCNSKTENPISWNRAPVSEGVLRIYSGDDQFLGTLVGVTHIYIASLGKLMNLSGDNVEPFFKTEGCTGTPYSYQDRLSGAFIFVENFRNGAYKFYHQSGPAEYTTFLSHRTELIDGSYQCEPMSDELILSPLTEVALPFSYPVVEPLKLK
jgi:quinol monooxygenase YgiN